jgi:flagellar basal-body rod modification protein FlgD
MSAISPAGSSANVASNQTRTSGNDLRELNLDHFMKLLVTELQNQDPLNPMDNTQMVQQLSTIREIGATNQLSETLGAFSLTQQLTTASSLIGRKVDGMSDDGKEVAGKVERVSVETNGEDSSKRKIKVHVGGKTMEVQNIRQIRPDGA